MASHYANLAVTQLHIIARLRMVPPVHKPGIEMGDIAPSGPQKPDNEGNPKAMSDPHANYHAQFTKEPLRKLFLLLDPHLTHPSTHDHHAVFIQVHRALNKLIDALSPF